MRLEEFCNTNDETLTESSLASYIMTGEVGALIGILVTDALGMNNPMGQRFKDRSFFLTKFLAGQAIRKLKEMDLHRKLSRLQNDPKFKEAVQEIVEQNRLTEMTKNRLMRVLDMKMTDDEIQRLMSVVKAIASKQQDRLRKN